MSQEVTPPVGHDLRAFFRSVGGLRGGALTSGEDRVATGELVEMLDSAALKIAAEPILVQGAIDGIQSQMVVGFRGHRPVLLTYTAAGCLTPAGKALGVREHLSLLCSVTDAPWAKDLGTTIPIEELEATSPPEVEREALSFLSGSRDRAEQVILRDLLEQSGVDLPVGVASVPGNEPAEQVLNAGGVFLVDGSLGSRDGDLRLVGLSKTVGKRYLEDEEILYRLPVGWRSPRFFIPAGMTGTISRYSCYLRLSDASSERWSHGLVRLEAHDPELLDGACAFALSNRQNSGSSDARWDRHLRIVRGVEDFLRARRPPIFSLKA